MCININCVDVSGILAWFDMPPQCILLRVQIASSAINPCERVQSVSANWGQWLFLLLGAESLKNKEVF